MKVFVSCADNIPSASVVFDTLRIGFPNAEITVGVVGRSHSRSRDMKSLGCAVKYKPTMYHPDWIRSCVASADGPIVILDGDIIFYEKVEDWEFPTLLAGYYVPLMWNDFSRCVSFPRLHTSFLWVRDGRELLGKIKETYPLSTGHGGEYCPTDPFSPKVAFINREPYFWDSCCGLYQMLGGTPFNAGQKASYVHLHSASFYELMHERLENKVVFEWLHREGYKDEKAMRVYQKMVDSYYWDRHTLALSKQASSLKRISS